MLTNTRVKFSFQNTETAHRKSRHYTRVLRDVGYETVYFFGENEKDDDGEGEMK